LVERRPVVPWFMPVMRSSRPDGERDGWCWPVFGFRANPRQAAACAGGVGNSATRSGVRRNARAAAGGNGTVPNAGPTGLFAAQPARPMLLLGACGAGTYVE